MKSMLCDDIKAEMARIIERKLAFDHYRLFVFGSRVGSIADVRSGIDVGIESSEPIPLGVLNDIRSEIDELPILQKDDIVDFATVGRDFKDVAMKNIEAICEK